jgi:hypothetical protein
MPVGLAAHIFAHGRAGRCEIIHGAPDAIRTHDTRFRRAVLYPLSYRG